jgi:hypothetical protein
MTTRRHGSKRAPSPPILDQSIATSRQSPRRQRAPSSPANTAERTEGLERTRKLIARGRVANTKPAGEREQDALVRALATSLADFDISVPTNGDFAQVVAAMCDGLRQLSSTRQAAEAELSQVTADKGALKALVATQREELRSLRQQIESLTEVLRQQRSLDGHQLTDLSQRYSELMTTYREFRVQADTIYAAFEHLRSAGLTGIWRVFGATLRDRELYDAVVLILTSGLFDEDFFRRQCRSGEIPGRMSPLIYYLSRGDGWERDPHPLFSVSHYRSQLSEMRRPRNFLLDYLQYGHDLSPHPLFMPRYYLEQLPGLANITGIAPLMHYCIAGRPAEASPHPLFDNKYYLKQLEAQGVNPPANLLSFYLSGSSPEVSPHPLFGMEFYRRRYLSGQTEADPLIHYLTVGDREGNNPHAYFHTRFYRHANPDSARNGMAALVHFILEGAEANRAPHPMFDLTYYKSANPEISETGHRLLVHFIAEGEAKGANPHPLIDLAYVKRQLAERELDDSHPFRALLDPANVDWLSPHPLFDIEFYRSRSPGAVAYAGGAFLYYLLAGYKLDEPVHPLFDPAFYRSQAQTLGIEVADPLAHYLTRDAASAEPLVNPHPLFDIDYYTRAGSSVIDRNPLLHYLTRGDKGGRDPHPLFDVAYYKRSAGLADEPALVHYMATVGRAGDPHPLFDTQYYLAGLAEQPLPGVAPLVHYLMSDDGSAADPHPLFDQAYYWSQVAEDERRSSPALLHYLDQPAVALSPHRFFDLTFFKAGPGGTQPALLAFLSQFREDPSPPLHRLEWREANRRFCGLSYLLDHPDLPAGEVPILHYLRAHGEPEPLTVHELPSFSRDLQHQAVDVQRLIDCARERERRGVPASAWVRDEDFRLLGDLLANVEICSSSIADDSDLAGRLSGVPRVAIYALEPGREGLWLYHRQMIGALRNAGYATVVVADSLDDRILPDQGVAVDLWVSHAGDRRDFRLWSAALAHIAPWLAEAKQLLLLNDNLVGPFGDLRLLLRQLERSPAEIRGLTETVDGERRLQADLLLISGDALTSGAVARMLATGLGSNELSRTPALAIEGAWTGSDRIAPNLIYTEVAKAWTRTVPDQIAWAQRLGRRGGDLGLAAHLPQALLRRYADYLEDWLTDRADRVLAGEQFDPQHIFWDALIGPQFPFLNKELLQVNPLRVPTFIRLGEVCARYGDETSRASLRELVPDTGGFPRSYLRLSEALIDADASVMV